MPGPPVIDGPGLLSATRVARVTGGTLVRGNGVAAGVSTDSRSASKADLFLALRGLRHDGHDFVPDAIRRGAAGVVVEDRGRVGESWRSDVFVVAVDDTRRALLDLARDHRRALAADVVAITGSCGKTSTKEMAAHLLAGTKACVAAEKSFNNEIGVPLTLFRAGDETELVILELGTNAPGEIERLAGVAAPDIGLITMIGRGHLAGLSSIEGVRREKGALLEAIREDGVAILGADDAAFGELRQRAAGRRILTFGVNREADVRATALRPGRHRVGLTVVDDSGAYPVELPRLGLHDVRNLLAALCVGKALGCPMSELVARLPSLRYAPRRLEPKQGRREVSVIDDTYNANPDSLLAALAVLDTQEVSGHRVLVLGDMLELGAESEHIHRSLGTQLLRRVDRLVTVGPLAKKVAEAFGELGGAARSFDVVAQLMPGLDTMFRPGDLVLFKASRGVGLDRAVDALVDPSHAPSSL